MVATTVPVMLALLIGAYVFRFDDALVLGCRAGARISTPALELIADKARSQVPAPGYAVPYAASTTLLTIGGICMVMLMGRGATSHMGRWRRDTQRPTHRYGGELEVPAGRSCRAGFMTTVADMPAARRTFGGSASSLIRTGRR